MYGNYTPSTTFYAKKRFEAEAERNLREQWSQDLNAVGWAHKLKGPMLFLMMPALYIGIQMLFGFRFPLPIYYLFALIMGGILFVKTLRDPEIAICVFIVYLPLSGMIKISIAPVINGTNLMIGLMILALMLQAARAGKPILNSYPLTTLMGFYGVYSSLSIVTAVVSFGPHLFVDNMLDFKGWLDHFVIFFIFVNIIKDSGQARRIIIYIIISASIVALYGVDELLEKSGRSTIDKSRLLGPQQQPNEFGAFLAHSTAPLVGILGMYWSNFRSWAIIPYFVILMKLIIASFSRGAMLGFASGIIYATFTRGIRFLFLGILSGMVVIYQFPELLPQSVAARFAHTQSQDPGTTQQLDQSSHRRLVLWQAAAQITLENPLLGTGFKTFRVIKGYYTSEDVHENDPHNMYLFICSQMGLPALILLLVILFKAYLMSRKVFREHPSKFARAIGLGGVALIVGVTVINMFGTRMFDIGTVSVLWIYMAVIIRLHDEMKSFHEDKELSKHPILP